MIFFLIFYAFHRLSRWLQVWTCGYQRVPFIRTPGFETVRQRRQLDCRNTADLPAGDQVHGRLFSAIAQFICTAGLPCLHALDQRRVHQGKLAGSSLTLPGTRFLFPAAGDIPGLETLRCQGWIQDRLGSGARGSPHGLIGFPALWRLRSATGRRCAGPQGTGPRSVAWSDVMRLLDTALRRF